MRLNLIRESKAEIVQILDAGGKYNGVSDDGDLADVAIRDSLQAANLTRQRFKLKAIEEALRKIADGNYGICEDCEEDIPVGRLNVMPFALRCFQEAVEKTSTQAKAELDAMVSNVITSKGLESLGVRSKALALEAGKEYAGDCEACNVEAKIGTEEIPHPIDRRLHTCIKTDYTDDD